MTFLFFSDVDLKLSSSKPDSDSATSSSSATVIAMAESSPLGSVSVAELFTRLGGRDGDLLTSSGATVPASRALSDARVVALYFSAHWCPPCRQFTPLLRRAFQQARAAGRASRTALVFVSSDRSEAEQLSYMREAHGDWPAVRAGSELAR